MKRTMIRALAITILTTSMSAFAMPENAKATGKTTRNATKCAAIAASDAADGQNSHQGGGKPAEGKGESQRQKLIEQQDKEWLHSLQGIFG